MVSIVIPQAFRIILPPLTNELILLTKDSSLVYLLGVTLPTRELAKFGRDSLNQYVSMTPILVAGLAYLIITVPLGYVVAPAGGTAGEGAMIAIRDLHKSFGELEVLKGIDFDVARGRGRLRDRPVRARGSRRCCAASTCSRSRRPARSRSATTRSPTPTSTSTRSGAGSAWCSSSSTCSRT